MSDKAKTEAAKAVIAQCYKDQSMEINGREYKFTKTTHKKRRTVYAFMSNIARKLAIGDFSFLDTPEWDRIESIVSDIVTYEDMAMSKLQSHWETYPQDYLLFSTTAIQVISHPFLAGNPTD